MNDELLQDQVFISKDSKLYYYFFDDEKDKIENFKLDSINTFSYLGNTIILEEGFTLRNYFELIKNYETLQMLDSFFKCFVEEFNSCLEDLCKSADIDYLVLDRHIMYSSADAFEPPIAFNGMMNDIISDDGLIHTDKSIDQTIEFHGYSKNEDQFYGIDMRSLSELLDYEIVIGNAKLFIDIDIKYNAVEDNLTLFDFIKSIIWELSFYGCSKNRKKQRELLKISLDEAMTELDNN